MAVPAGLALLFQQRLEGAEQEGGFGPGVESVLAGAQQADFPVRKQDRVQGQVHVGCTSSECRVRRPVDRFILKSSIRM